MQDLKQLPFNMMSYARDHIIPVIDGKYDFPDQFDNEIFYSRVYNPVRKPIKYISNFSIKYVLKGQEHYEVNGEQKRVDSGKMLIVNDQSVVANTAGISEAFSIFIEKEIIKDCQNNLIRSAQKLLDDPFDKANTTINFYDNVLDHNIPDLEQLKLKVRNNADMIIPIDYYYELAKSLLLSQNRTFGIINRIQKVNLSTKKEIFKRINIGLDYLNDQIDGKFDLSKLAKASCMSKYHFIRCFKQIHGLTPNRYFILKKMEKARRLIQLNENWKIQDIAFELGYPDLASFSKQFKQIYGVSPQRVKENG